MQATSKRVGSSLSKKIYGVSIGVNASSGNPVQSSTIIHKTNDEAVITDDGLLFQKNIFILDCGCIVELVCGGGGMGILRLPRKNQSVSLMRRTTISLINWKLSYTYRTYPVQD